MLMGALCTNDKEIHEKLKFLQLGEQNFSSYGQF